jgi:hypothetical protein
MKITLTPQESEQFFYNSLCNGLGYVTSGYGLEFDYNEEEYKKAKVNWIKANNNEPCLEDVLMQILRDGGSLTLIDVEGGEDEKHTITMAEVHERVQLTDAQRLIDMQTENDDAVTADCIIQTVFFKDVIFG